MIHYFFFILKNTFHFSLQIFKKISALNTLPDIQDLKGTKTLLIPITSDRGLCGSLNTQVVRETRKIMDDTSSKGGSTVLAIIGDKGVAQLQR